MVSADKWTLGLPDRAVTGEGVVQRRAAPGRDLRCVFQRNLEELKSLKGKSSGGKGTQRGNIER